MISLFRLIWQIEFMFIMFKLRLKPFAPPYFLIWYLNYYGSSDSCPAMSGAGQASLLHVVEPSGHSASNHPSSPQGHGLVSYPRLTDSTTRGRLYPFLGTFASLGLRHLRAGSPRRQAESSSSSYGLAVHLRLLSTSSHENAVTFGYRVQTLLWRGLPPR